MREFDFFIEIQLQIIFFRYIEYTKVQQRIRNILEYIKVLKESGIPLPVDEIAAEMSKIKESMQSINN